MSNQERTLWTLLTTISIILVGNYWLDYIVNVEPFQFDQSYVESTHSDCLSARSSYTYKFPYTDSETERMIAADIDLKRAFTYHEKEHSRIPGINDYIFVQKKPVPLNLEYVKSQIGYPQIAQNSAIQGEILVRILVDERGKYMKHWIINDLHLHPILKLACEDHIDELHFSPAIQCGNPVKYWVNVPFTFYMVK